jgi:hypothetical protein
LHRKHWAVAAQADPSTLRSGSRVIGRGSAPRPPRAVTSGVARHRQHIARSTHDPAGLRTSWSAFPYKEAAPCTDSSALRRHYANHHAAPSLFLGRLRLPGRRAARGRGRCMRAPRDRLTIVALRLTIS